MKKQTIEGKLPILVSTRIRLSPEQRQDIKHAYKRALNSGTPSEGHKPPMTSIRTSTSWSSPELDKALGMSQLVFTDLVNTRDSISMPVLLKVQEVLGVDVVTPDQIMEACQQYVDYVFNQQPQVQ